MLQLAIYPDCQGGSKVSICVVFYLPPSGVFKFLNWYSQESDDNLDSNLHKGAAINRIADATFRSLGFQRFTVESVQIARPNVQYASVPTRYIRLLLINL